MSTWSRSTKPNGTTSYANSELLRSADLESDIANGVTVVNGNIENANVSGSAAIETSKIDGYSDSATERTTETTPGVTGTESDATTMAGELERLRYKQKELGLGSSVKRLDGTAGVDLISWIDTPAVGPNLIRNGNFAVKTTAAGSAPDGWALVGTPGTCTTTTTGVTEGHSTGRAIRIAAAGAANEGISQTLVGLKASTKYLVGCRGKVNVAADILGLVTTGATGATFGNLSLQTTSTSYVTISGVIVTDATPTSIVVQLLAVADGDSVDVTHVWVRECATDPIPLSDTAVAYHEVTTNTANHYSAGPVGNDDSGLTANVVCPGPGYVIHVAAKLDVEATGASTAILMKLEENGTEVDCAYTYIDGNAARNKASVSFNYVKRDPTPGTTYTYTVNGSGMGDDITRNGTAFATETPKSWIRVRAYLESGGH